MLTLLLAVATWRVTHLLVVDEWPLVRAVRDWVIRTFAVVNSEGEIVAGKTLGGFGHSVAYLWTCPWCMSVWVGAGLVWLADWHGSVPYPWLIVAAGSALTGVASWLEDEHEQRHEARKLQVDRWKEAGR